MFKNLYLERPLAVLDLETTGTDPAVDRIVEISILKVLPAGGGLIQPGRRQITLRCNPGVPIPPEATACHHITDEDVANEPPFRSVAMRLLRFLEGCDLCGFNIRRFDLPLLVTEFDRAGFAMNLEGRKVVDPYLIYLEREKRDLTAAVAFYCGRAHEGAHGAAADVQATVDVLDAQIAHYEDLPTHVDSLHEAQTDPDALDMGGKFRVSNGGTVFTFGKYAGQFLEDIAQTKPDYVQWMLNQSFLPDAKAIVRQALEER
jgi:DNA polymerase III subunit epsilon